MKRSINITYTLDGIKAAIARYTATLDDDREDEVYASKRAIAEGELDAFIAHISPKHSGDEVAELRERIAKLEQQLVEKDNAL